MAVYSYDIAQSTSPVKSWVPTKHMELSELEVIDISGDSDYYVALTKRGTLYLTGRVPWMDFNSQSLVPLLGIPPSIAVVKMSTSPQSMAFLTSTGQVYACGKYFTSQLSLLYSSTDAKFIAASELILVATESTLITYSSQTISHQTTLDKLKVQSVASFLSMFFILLDDGILYSTAEVSQNTLQSQVPDLYIIDTFLGPEMVYLHSQSNELLCIYCDGTIVYGWATRKTDNIYPSAATLPDFPDENGSICHALISRDYIWIQTSTGDIYYISKLPYLNPENGHIGRYKHVPEGFPSKITHIAANWSHLILFESGIAHMPIADNLQLNTLPNRVDPFIIRTKHHGSCLIDPLGALSVGLRPGDRVTTSARKQQIVIGTSQEGELAMKNIESGIIELIPMPDLATLLFSWKLFYRHLANLTDVAITAKDQQQLTLQIDCSEKGLSRICFFKPDDIIEHKKFGVGTVLGERCNSVWIQYDKTVRMCSASSSRAIHTEHKIIKRPGVESLLVHEGIDNQIIIIEPTTTGVLEPESIVASTVYGIGTYKGVSAGQLVIHFINDGPYCRIVPTSHNISLKRSVNRITSQPFFCLDSTIKNINVSLNTCKEQFGIVPCDIIKINNQIAFCVGCCMYEDELSLMFETETMIKHGLGIGTFTKGQFNLQYEMIARIAHEGKVTKKLSNGNDVELSINTDDFQEAKLLPGDELTLNGKQCHVCGIDNNHTLYIQYEATKLAEALSDDAEFVLVYRRINVPTKVVAKVVNSDFKQNCFIDLEHLRDAELLPCDVVENDNEKVAVVGAIDQNRFIVCNPNQKNDNDETGILIVPTGHSSSVLSSVFDADDADE